jgi:transposase
VERRTLGDLSTPGPYCFSDAGTDGPSWGVADTAEALGVSSRTIEHLKKRFVEEGLDAALERKQREKPPREVTFDGAFEARLIAMACSNVPEGYRRWTVRLLADKAVELNFAESVSHMTVQRVLKKTNLSLTSASTGKSLQKETQHS